MLVRVADAAAQVAFVVDEVRRLTSGGGVGGGDIGVFAPDRNRVRNALQGLRTAGLRCQSLNQFDGVPNDAVKVDTFHRAKGLEFKVVFLLGAAAFPRPRSARQTDAEYAEQRAMQISQLFVAMTRARDRLFVLCKDRPSDVLAGALAHSRRGTIAADLASWRCDSVRSGDSNHPVAPVGRRRRIRSRWTGRTGAVDGGGALRDTR